GISSSCVLVTSTGRAHGCTCAGRASDRRDSPSLRKWVTPSLHICKSADRRRTAIACSFVVAHLFAPSLPMQPSPSLSLGRCGALVSHRLAELLRISCAIPSPRLFCGKALRCRTSLRLLGIAPF